MAAPQFVPTNPAVKPRDYSSPDYVPPTWVPRRPGELLGRQPSGDRQGYQGPDQGYGLVLANRFRDRIHVTARESVDDAVRGGLGIGLRRASLYGRAPVVHDFTIAYTIWGFLDPSPPAELLAVRVERFEGVHDMLHHYAEWRAIVDAVPETTLRMTPQQASAKYPAAWRELVGES